MAPPEKVIVSEETQPVSYLDPTSKKKIDLGNVVSRVYEGENVQRHEFYANEDGPDKAYRLGPTSTAFKFVNHSDVMKPMFDQGWECEDTILSRGGLHFHSVWTNPASGILKDPMNWDRSLWGDGEKGLKESMVVTTAIRPGKGIHYQRGYFRMICTNGLVSNILKLGAIKMTHTSWNPDRLVEELFGDDVQVAAGEVNRGPLVGSNEGVAKFAEFLSGYGEEHDTSGLPLFVSDQISPFNSIPVWFYNNLETLFGRMAKGPKKVFALDVMNAVTGAANLGRSEGDSERSMARPLSKTPALISGATNLIGGLSV